MPRASRVDVWRDLFVAYFPSKRFAMVAAYAGPCACSGFSMRESHRGMTVTERAFNAVVQALADALDELEVAVPTQNRLLARLAPLRDDIVYQ